MNNKIKILLVLLGVVSLLAVILAAWIFLSAQIEVQGYIKKHASLEKDNTSLKTRLDTSQEDARLWKEKSESITQALNQLSKEHTLLASQYTALQQERQTLNEQNTSLTNQMEELKKLYAKAQQPKTQLVPETSDAFLAALLKEKAALEVEVEELKKNIAYQEGKMQEMEEQARPIALLQDEKQILEKKLEEASKLADVLSNDLVAERKRVSSLQKEMAKVDSQFQEMLTERDELADQLSKMKVVLQERIEDLDQTKKTLEAALEGAKPPIAKRETFPASTPLIQLPPIVVRAEEEKAAAVEKAVSKVLAPISPKPQAQTAAQVPPQVPPPVQPTAAAPAAAQLPKPGVCGRIITVNEKHKFVVIDIGQADGVKAGMSFGVYRQDKKVAGLKVIEARENITACDIQEASIHSLRVGDSVRQ